MMTRQLEISILAAPLASIDRRVLSQAWYSALRLGREERTLPAPHARAIDGRFDARAGHIVAGARSGPRAAASTLRSRVTARAAIGPAELSRLRRTSLQRAVLARAIVTTFSQPQTGLKRATFSLGPGSGRIHVVLQTKGERTTLVALCPPELTVVVARALAQARLTLAQRGIGVALYAQGRT